MTMRGGVAGAFTVRRICLEPGPPLPVALTVNVETPAAKGVSLIMPEEDPGFNLAGNLPRLT